MPVLLAVPAIAAICWLLWLAGMLKRHGPGTLLWRWFSGMPLDGHHRTDATWSRKSTRTLHPAGRVVAWHHLPRGVRATIRSGGTALCIFLAWGTAFHPLATLAVVGAVVLAAVALAVRPAVRRVRHWRHHRVYVRPLARALTHELSGPPPRLAIEPDRSRVVVGLPEEFTGSDREKEGIVRAVTAKLAIEAPDAAWSLDRAGGKPQVTFTKSQPPPGRVGMTAIQDAIAGAAEHEIVMGLGKKSLPVITSVDNDSPHLGLSMGSGDGKSTVAKNMACQLLHHGALLMVLDIKLISHMWARGLPNVSYAGTPAEIESALVWLAAEVSRRNKVALAGADIEGKVRAHVGPRIFLIAEELNATQNRLKAWWNREMEMKGRSPGSEALDEVMFLGRQVLVNVLQIGQRLSVKASGSGDARENLGVLVFSDPTAAAWKMLCSQHAMPPASGHLGRLQVVTRKAVRETQGAYWTGQEARDFATSGTVAQPRHDMPCVSAIGPVPVRAEIPDTGDEQPAVLRQPPPVLGPAGAVTLREAVDAGIFRTIDAARKTAQRHLQPVGERDRANLYDVGDLQEFLRR